MRFIAIFLIKAYQKIFYPIIKPIFPSSCRFNPTCSEFMIISLKKYGFIKGGYLGIIRILKCNPWFN